MRFFQAILILSTIGLSWLSMMAVHEFGHVLNAWLSGGSVERVVLDPFSFSRTDLADNPHPLFVVWGGPLWGCFLPLLMLAGASQGAYAPRSVRYLFRFFAGFCLIANGAYIGGGSFIEAGDAGDMLRQGSPQWTLIGFGLLGLSYGLRLWNGLGAHFGLGRSKGEVNPRHTLGVSAVCAFFYTAAFLFGRE